MFLRKTIYVLLLGLLSAGGGLAQEAGLDSSGASSENGIYFDIARTRVVRWLRLHQAEVPKGLFEQVIQLIREADSLAQKGDYDTALLLVDTAAESMHSIEAAVARAPDSSSAPAAQPVSRGWRFRPQLLSGVDFWRQELELGLAGDFTTSRATSGNPYGGLRIYASTDGVALGELNLYSQLKYSRDYRSAEFELRTLKGSTNHSHWGFENRMEAIGYHDTTGVSNWENRALLRGGVELFNGFLFLTNDEFRYRKYAALDSGQSSFFNDNWENSLSGGFQYASGLSTRLRSQYTFSARGYPAFSGDNYVEHRVEASAYQLTATNSSIFIENIWRKRIYSIGDSCRSYKNSFQEEYLRSDFRFGLSNALSFDVQADFTLRQYDVACEQTPDYFHLSARPRFLFRLIGDLQLGLGYLYVLRVYQKDIIRTDLTPSVATDTERQISFEDYFSHGLSVSLELFRLGAFMLSLTNEFELRTYPNAMTNAVQGLGLFTDRRINSLLLLINWNVAPQLEFGVLVNHDNDQSRQENQSDFRNTLFSLETAFSF